MFATNPRKYPCFVTEVIRADESTEAEFMYEEEISDMMIRIQDATMGKKKEGAR